MGAKSIPGKAGWLKNQKVAIWDFGVKSPGKGTTSKSWPMRKMQERLRSKRMIS